MHDNGRMMFERYALPRFKEGYSVLEVGPSRSNTALRDLLPAHTRYFYADVRNFDIGAGKVDMTGPYSIKAADRAFDVVFAAQVIEHVTRPWLWVPELARVAKREVVLLGPVSYAYHVSKGVPDCWRIFADGMRELLMDAGLAVIACETASLDGVHTDTVGIGGRI